MRLVTDIYPALIEHEQNCDGDTQITALRGTLEVSCIGKETSSVMECGWEEEFSAK